MRKEAVTSQTSTWRLERIPVTPTVRSPASARGVTLTEIDFEGSSGESAGSKTGYPFLSLKK